MDPLDSLLLEHWDRISLKLRKQRVMALRRSRRRFKGVLTRPMREWCLVIRASDTRINHSKAAFDVHPEQVYELHEEHTVTLRGTLIRELTKPVTIPWPGVTYHQAAKLLGRTHASMDTWVKHGAFKVERYPSFKYPENGKPRGPKPRQHRSPKVMDIVGVNGHGRPHVWTPSPIDPNNFHGRTPHPVWGTLWQTLWSKLPEDYVLEVKRVPRIRMQKVRDGSLRARFVGWEFVCPGRLDENGEYASCGRHATYLYAPQTVWTLAKALWNSEDGDLGFDMPEDSGLAGQWCPGLSDPVKEAAPGGRSFACKHCWGVRSALMSSYVGWNDFITQISGGLLRGKEVPRPLDICPIERKRKEYRQRGRKRLRAGEAGAMVLAAS